MARLQFFAFYPDAFMGSESVKLMTMAERGAYITLLCHAWENDGLPTSLALLARVCGVSKDEMTELWEGPLGECWEERDGRFVNPRQEEERDRASEKSGAAKKAAETRWAKKRAAAEKAAADANAMRTHSERNADAYADAMHPQCERSTTLALPPDQTRPEHSLTSFVSENARAREVGPQLRKVLAKELEPLSDEAMALVVRLDAQTREARKADKRAGPEMGSAAWRKHLALARRDLEAFRVRVELTEERSAKNLQEPDPPRGGGAKPHEKLTARGAQKRRNDAVLEEMIRRDRQGPPGARVVNAEQVPRPFGLAGGSGSQKAAQAEVGP